MRISPYLLQWRRTGREEPVAGQYREDRQRVEDEPAESVWPRVSLGRIRFVLI
jgi:hypothetical protein